MAKPREKVQIDFRGQIRFLSPEEGGRKQTPRPGYRPDFRYVGQTEQNLWMIWPLWFFVDGEEVPPGTHVPQEVEAGFFVLDGDLLETVHRDRLRPGVRFEICEGSHVVATGEVTEVTNSTDNQA